MAVHHFSIILQGIPDTEDFSCWSTGRTEEEARNKFIAVNNLSPEQVMHSVVLHVLSSVCLSPGVFLWFPRFADVQKQGFPYLWFPKVSGCPACPIIECSKSSHAGKQMWRAKPSAAATAARMGVKRTMEGG